MKHVHLNACYGCDNPTLLGTRRLYQAPVKECTFRQYPLVFYRGLLYIQSCLLKVWRGSTTMLITENQLDEWASANAEAAKGTIVELIWRLVAASCPKPRERRFPLGDSIGQHGPDGVLAVDLGFDPFIPDGRSFWQVGTGLRAGAKATDDYNELTEGTPRNVREESTFVFVTPRSGRRDWEFSWKEDAQATWLEERQKRGEWKDVRIIDGTKIIDWLHQFPAVELWLAKVITSTKLDQVEMPSEHWEVVRSFGEPPPLIPDLFLANRSEACGKLREVFDGTIVQLKIATHYPDQVVDLVSAYLASLDEESRVDAAGKCLLVTGVEGWNTICGNSHWKNLVLVADASLDLSGDAGAKLIQKARRASHSVIFAGAQGGVPDPTGIRLSLPQPHQVQEALEKAGHPHERARVLAQKSAGNLGSLLRCLQNLSVLPEWAEKTDAAELAIALILGSWNEDSAADRAVAETMSGKAYGEWIQAMREISLRASTPLTQRESSWKFIPRYEGWYSLGPHVFDDHLNRLRTSSITVFREVDPKFELPAQERYAASIHGKVMSHSAALRSGLAEALALLGSHPQALTSCSLGKAEATASLVIRETLADSDWIHWASLNDVLPILAEAAPGAFLDALEKALQQTPCPFDEIFAQEGDGIFGGNYMTGLLWALETVAWETEHLNRAVLCLGELAARDPGGNSGNRPISSLTTIFLPWLPQTSAPSANRETAIRVLLKEFPDVGWKLLLSLLPKQHNVSFGTRRPLWRASIPDDWRDGVTHREHWEQANTLAELAISEAGSHVHRLIDLVDNLDSIPYPARQQLLDRLTSDTIRVLPDADRLPLWDRLVDLVTRHRKYGDAEWAMKPPQIDEVVAVVEQLSPHSPFFVHQRLFSGRDFDLLEEKSDYARQRKELDERRQKAIKEVAAEGGIKAVHLFAQSVQSPGLVGVTFGIVTDGKSDETILPTLLEGITGPLAQFAGGFTLGRYRAQGWEWVDSIDATQWTPEQVGQFFSFLPFSQETWNRAEALLGKNASTYWQKTPANPYEAGESLDHGIEQLIKYGRAYDALRCLHRMLDEKKAFSSEFAIGALREAVRSAESPHSMDVYETVEIIKALQEDPATDPQALSSVEWSFLPILDGHHGAKPKLLWRRLADDPAFFCEMIRLVFRSKKNIASTEEVGEERKSIATNAYRLLVEWHVPPGLGEDGNYDGEMLRSWLNAMRKECVASGHIEVATTMVGHVLTYVPADQDGLWINRSAAEALNARDAQDMRVGFKNQLYNSRGIHWVDPTGKEERELASKYRGQAEAVEKAGYPRLGHTLHQLADEYEQDARRVAAERLSDT